jgi:hypothetical protein
MGQRTGEDRKTPVAAPTPLHGCVRREASARPRARRGGGEQDTGLAIHLTSRTHEYPCRAPTMKMPNHRPRHVIQLLNKSSDYRPLRDPIHQQVSTMGLGG